MHAAHAFIPDVERYTCRMTFDAVMFDLDGTLADTLTDIAAAANHALTRLGRPTFPVSRYRYLAGQGLQWLMTEAMGADHGHLVEAGMSAFRAYYAEHSMDHTAPYDGISDLLDVLTERKVTLAVLSNKPDAATQQVVADVFDRWRFDAVRGQRDDTPLKPDPAGALAIVSKLGIPADRWLYVGDTNVDMQTAKAAGMFALGVLWGFRDEPELRASGADAIIAHPREVLRYTRPT